jgi:4-hydroxy-tetrahydrodipicolinate synthase
MARLTVLEGIIPSPAVVFTDASCETVDYDAYREHMQFLLRHDISALCIGGHAGETECLTMEERLKVLSIAQEEAKGRVPVMGGVVADSTWSAIEQTKIQKDHGADCVLVCPPNIVGWDAVGADAMLVAHFKAINDKGGLPFVIYGGPGDNSSCRQMPATFTKVATECDLLVAWKIAVRGIATGENSFADCVAALQKAKAVTGRTVNPLIAGDANLLGALESGGQGTINACESFRVDDSTALYKAFRAGDMATARKIHELHKPISDIIYGIRIGRSFTYFHYRVKIASWLLGYIPNPYMRLPQVPPPADEITMLYDALIKAGKKPVHTPQEFFQSAPAGVLAAE